MIWQLRACDRLPRPAGPGSRVSRRSALRCAAAFFCVAALQAALLLAPGLAQAAPQLLAAVVASVDGTPITLREFQAFRLKSARMLPPEERGNNAVILEALINERLFGTEYRKHGIVASDEDVQIYMDRVFAQNRTSREQVTQGLEQVGLTWDEYFERMRDEVRKAQLINREVRARVNVTPEEVQRYWESEDPFALPERVEIGHIFLPVPPDPTQASVDELLEQARAVREEAAAGARAFENAARKYSKGPTAAEGGSLGVFKRGTMSEEFEAAVAKLREGEVSEPLPSRQGVHILRLHKKMETGRVPLAEVQEEIRSKLYDEKLESRFRRWIQSDLRDRHYVAEFYDEVLALQ